MIILEIVGFDIPAQEEPVFTMDAKAISTGDPLDAALIAGTIQCATACIYVVGSYGMCEGLPPDYDTE
jgi:hypothetical protein